MELTASSRLSCSTASPSLCASATRRSRLAVASSSSSSATLALSSVPALLSCVSASSSASRAYLAVSWRSAPRRWTFVHLPQLHLELGGVARAALVALTGSQRRIELLLKALALLGPRGLALLVRAVPRQQLFCHGGKRLLHAVALGLQHGAAQPGACAAGVHRACTSQLAARCSASATRCSASASIRSNASRCSNATAFLSA